jgi:DNA-binding transcriptional LysR family regulator
VCGRGDHRRINRLTVAFDAMPFARWGPLFHVLCIERPRLLLEWQAVGFPTRERSLLRGADVGLFVAPPHEAGLSALTIETSQMLVLLPAGHRLGGRHELSIADVLDEPFIGAPNLHAEWRAFWTLDQQRGGPGALTDDRIQNAEQGVHVVASGRAIATVPATIASGLAHPGVVTVPLIDGPPVTTCVVWHSDDQNPLVRSLVELAGDMTRDPRGGWVA